MTNNVDKGVKALLQEEFIKPVLRAGAYINSQSHKYNSMGGGEEAKGNSANE